MYNEDVHGKKFAQIAERIASGPVDRHEGEQKVTTDQRATASSGEQIAALMHRGLVAASAGQRARARRYFAAVLEIDPTCVEAWLERVAVRRPPD